MTEQEAINRLEFLNDALNFNRADADESSCALQMGIEALEEIQQYRALGTVEEILKVLDNHKKVVAMQHETLKEYRNLGTVEELRVARDKQIPKKPSKDEFDRCICPDCGWIVYTDEYGGRYLLHCENCGQKLDWSDEE